MPAARLGIDPTHLRTSVARLRTCLIHLGTLVERLGTRTIHLGTLATRPIALSIRHLPRGPVMPSMLRLIQIIWVALRYRLDELVLSSINHSIAATLLRIVRLGRAPHQ